MRCHEARKRLIETGGMFSDSDEDRRLLEHLRQCSACAELARAEQMLNRDFEAAQIDDNTDGLPFEDLKAQAEKRAGIALSHRNKEISFMDKLTGQLRKRPRLGISVALAIVLLITLTVIPFRIEHTIGYEVAIAGVDKDLALDPNKIDVLLDVLGLEDANFEVGDCSTTCVVRISDLKSQDDLNYVIAAFDEIGNCSLEEVSEVSGNEPITILKHVKASVLSDEDHDVTDVASVHAIVIDLLGCLEDSLGEGLNIWISAGCDSADDYNVLTFEPDSTHIRISGDCRNMKGLTGDSLTCRIVDLSTACTGSVQVYDASDNQQILDLDDPETLEILKEKGVDISSFNKDDSMSGEIIIYQINCGDENTSDAGAATPDNESVNKSSDNVPDKFELNQNYPNPFNPTTEIGFSLPEPGHVKLEIFNIYGQKVRTLINKTIDAGVHSVGWNSLDDSGKKAASGVYMYRLNAGDYIDSKKMTLLK